MSPMISKCHRKCTFGIFKSVSIFFFQFSWPLEYNMYSEAFPQLTDTQYLFITLTFHFPLHTSSLIIFFSLLFFLFFIYNLFEPWCKHNITFWIGASIPILLCNNLSKDMKPIAFKLPLKAKKKIARNH